jgi:hypothetical protein
MSLLLVKIKNLIGDLTGIDIPFLETIADKGGMFHIICGNSFCLNFRLKRTQTGKEVSSYLT